MFVGNFIDSFLKSKLKAIKGQLKGISAEWLRFAIRSGDFPPGCPYPYVDRPLFAGTNQPTKEDCPCEAFAS